MTYGWVRRSCHNEEDKTNIINRQLGGWKPIPADRHPEMSGVSWFGEAPTNYVERGGLVWCEIESDKLKPRLAQQRKQAMDAIPMKHLGVANANKTMPVFNNSEVGIERVTSERLGGDEFKE
jgi:hypothetical protein